jgi:hypothetical protein
MSAVLVPGARGNEGASAQADATSSGVSYPIVW